MSTLPVKYSYVIDQQGGVGGYLMRQVGHRVAVQVGYIYNTTELKRTVALLNKAVRS